MSIRDMSIWRVVNDARLHSRSLLFLLAAFLLSLRMPATAQDCGEVWNYMTGPTTSNLYSVTWGQDMFVAVGDNIIARSQDCITWQTSTLPWNDSLLGIAFGGGRYVATGFKGRVYVSNDSQTWEKADLKHSPLLFAAAYGDGVFFVAGFKGKIYTSSNGKHWTERYFQKSVPLFAMAYGQGRAIAVGYGGHIVMSLNHGRTWQRVYSGTWSPLVAITYGASGFVAVSQDGYVLRSQDGDQWQAVQLPDTSLYGITYTGSQYVLVGVSMPDNTGLVLTSSDAVNWSVADTHVPDVKLNSCAASAQMIIALGWDQINFAPMELFSSCDKQEVSTGHEY